MDSSSARVGPTHEWFEIYVPFVHVTAAPKIRPTIPVVRHFSFEWLEHRIQSFEFDTSVGRRELPAILLAVQIQGPRILILSNLREKRFE